MTRFINGSKKLILLGLVLGVSSFTLCVASGELFNSELDFQETQTTRSKKLGLIKRASNTAKNIYNSQAWKIGSSLCVPAVVVLALGLVWQRNKLSAKVALVPVPADTNLIVEKNALEANLWVSTLFGQPEDDFTGDMRKIQNLRRIGEIAFHSICELFALNVITKKALKDATPFSQQNIRMVLRLIDDLQKLHVECTSAAGPEGDLQIAVQAQGKRLLALLGCDPVTGEPQALGLLDLLKKLTEKFQEKKMRDGLDWYFGDLSEWSLNAEAAANPSVTFRPILDKIDTHTAQLLDVLHELGKLARSLPVPVEVEEVVAD